MTSNTATKRGGFSLVEMAVVISIIALLVGGIFIGRGLLRASRLQAITSEVARYQQAIRDFQDKYHALPGDMPNAESFWGSDSSCPSTPYTDLAHQATCNGNGDGHIGYNTGSASYDYEMYRAWQELANAHMIGGGYSGISGSGSTYTSEIGTNVPGSQFPLGGYTLFYLFMPSGDSAHWPAIYGHVLSFGAAVSNSYTYGAILTPNEAQEIDSKMDDGLPASGSIMTMQSSIYPNCTTSDNPAASLYNPSFSSVACGLLFLTGF